MPLVCFRSCHCHCFQPDLIVSSSAAKEGAGASKFDDVLDLKTPILKGFLTEIGNECASLGMQVWGGHGYIKDNGMEQVLRDCRIASLWEGTTQIQALDLLGRKIMLQKLKPINRACARLRGECAPLLLSSSGALRSHARQLYLAACDWQALTYRVAYRAASNRDAISLASVDYLMMGGYITLASHWLRMEATALATLESGGGDESDDFYRAKIQCSAFVFDRLLPRTSSHRAAMLAPLSSVADMHVDHFSLEN